METKEGIKESEAPLLLVSQGDSLDRHSLEKHLVCNVLENKFRNLNNPVLRNKKALGSSYGWLVLVNPFTETCCLFNPISSATIQLPKLNNADFYSKFIMTKPPTEPDCYIIFTSTSDELSFCRIGDEEYVTLSLIDKHGMCCDEEGVYMGDLMAIACFQGKIYGFIEPNKFVTIDLVDKSLEYTRPITLMNEDGTRPWVIPYPYSRGRIMNKIWLIKSCDDELLLVLKTYACVTVDKDGADFRVFRVDTNGMKCTEVENIGNRTIFLTLEDAGYCCPTPIGIKPNSIYFTNIRDRDFNIFDLEDRSRTSMLLPGGVAVWSTTVWVPRQMFNKFMHGI